MTDINEAGEAMYRFPWPPAEGESVLGSFVDTWRESVLHPGTFFRALPESGPTGPALLYYLVIGVLAAGIELFWSALLPDTGAERFGQMMGATPLSPLVDFLLSPLMLLLSILLAAGVTHLMVITLVAGNRGFGTTLRVFSFAYGPALFSVLPRLGAVVGFFWMTVISVIGLREAHRTSTARAVVAVLVPLLIGSLFLAASWLLLRSGALLTAP